MQEEDRSRCGYLHEELSQGRWRDVDFTDTRLRRLAMRMKARSFPNLLDESEVGAWRKFVAGKLGGEGDWLNMAGFEARLDELMLDETFSPDQHQVLLQLSQYAVELKNRYHL